MAGVLRPAGMSSRSGRGPRRLAVATAVAAIWIATSCAGQDVTIAASGSGGTTDRVVIRLAARPDGPTGDLSFGSASQPGGVGSTCWTQTEGVTGCRDVAVIPIPASPIEVPRAVVVMVEGDMSSASLRVGALVTNGSNREMGEATELELGPGGAALDVPEGDYVVEVDGTWPQGTAPLFFLLRVG